MPQTQAPIKKQNRAKPKRKKALKMGNCIVLIKAKIRTIFSSRRIEACKYRSHKLCFFPDNHGKTAVRQSIKNQSTVA